MRRAVVTLIFCAFITSLAVGQQTDEQVATRLMLIDVLVNDASGAPVRGLTKDDFQMTVRNTVRPIDTLDEICIPEEQRIPELAPRIALAFDYYGMTQQDRRRVVQAAADLLRGHKQPGDPVMIASLTSSLRVEQRFTDDLDLLLDTLERMEYDDTLATQQFGYLTGKQYFDNMATLLDVLAAYDGSKAVILYSATVTAPGATEERYRDLATRAAVGRSTIYPTGLRGVTSETPRPGARVLARLASDSGGTVGGSGFDATRLYETVRRELGCHYALGFYLEADEAGAPEDVRISVARPGVSLRYPAQVKLWSTEETRASRERAAFADPLRFEHPLVRGIAYPAGPSSPTTWSTLVAVHVPFPVGPDGETLDVSARLYRDDEEVADFSRQIELEPPASGSGVQPFTLFGEANTKKGDHELRVVLSKSGEKQVVASVAHFDLPEVPWGKLVLRGPLLARVEPEGMVIRSKKTTGVLLNEEIGDQSFEPLTVHEIKPSDTLLAGWQACRVKKPDPAESGAQVERMILDSQGNVAHAFPRIPLKLEGGKVACHRGLEKIEPGTLERGEYTVEVAIVRDGERVLEQSAPLLVD